MLKKADNYGHFKLKAEEALGNINFLTKSVLKHKSIVHCICKNSEIENVKP